MCDAAFHYETLVCGEWRSVTRLDAPVNTSNVYYLHPGYSEWEWQL